VTRCDREKWEHEEPKRLSAEEARKLVVIKTHVHEQLLIATEEEKAQLCKWLQPLEDFVVGHCGKFEWCPCGLTADDPGICVIVCKNENGKTTFKIRMSLHCLMQVKQQGNFFAFRLMNLKDAINAVPMTLAQAVFDLDLAGLAFHEERQEERRALVVMELCELMFACSQECVRSRTCERLVQLPCNDVQEAIVTMTFPPDKIARCGTLEVGSVLCLLTWITLICRLCQMAKMSLGFLSHNLAPEPKNVVLSPL